MAKARQSQNSLSPVRSLQEDATEASLSVVILITLSKHYYRLISFKINSEMFRA